MVPQIVEAFTNEYKAEMDPLKDFLDDVCVINPIAMANNSDLWIGYENWCKENGEKYQVGRKRFTQNLESHGFVQERISTKRFWRGIGIKDRRYVTDMTHCDSRKYKV